MTNEQFNNVYDIFHSYLVVDADYAECIEISVKCIPEKIFSENVVLLWKRQE